jgi:hypothetical protein
MDTLCSWPMLRLFICLALSAFSTVITLAVWLHFGEKTDALVKVAVICFGTFSFSTIMHVAIGICCPRKNCWPGFMHHKPLGDEDDEEEEGGGGGGGREGDAAAADQSAANEAIVAEVQLAESDLL